MGFDRTKDALRASTAGAVGAKVPLPGQVVKFSDELMQINGDESYILAYLHDEYMFNVCKGMSINGSGGAQFAKGKIETILTVADALPAEFQNMFRPRDRSRLIHVVLEGDNPFAVSQKVTVSGCAISFCWVQ